MVSLSTNEMLHKMVENYGYGAYLFSFLDIDQLEKLQQIDHNFDEYLDNLMKDRIYDPQAKQILIQKYKNDRWIHSPKLYEMEIQEEDWHQILTEKDDPVLFSKKLFEFIHNENNSEHLFRKGDVLFVFYKNDFKGYYIMDENKFTSVYLKYKDLWESVDPVPASFDMLGQTPANYWNEIHIPDLTFHFRMNFLFEMIKWSKIKVKNQNYLCGDFKYEKRKSKIYIPLSFSSTQEAKKLAIGLQVRNITSFYPDDPKNIIASEPSVLFGYLGENEITLNIEEEGVNDSEYYSEGDE